MQKVEVSLVLTYIIILFFLKAIILILSIKILTTGLFKLVLII